MIDRRYVATVLVILCLVTLTSGAYGWINPLPPPQQSFDKSGFIYTVGYECGYLEGDYNLALAGNYRTDIMIHNPTDRNQTFVIKFFPTKFSGEVLPPPLWSDAYVIRRDGVADIDCGDLSDVFHFGLDFYFRGFVIISHLRNGPKVPLDVIVAYTYRTDAGASKDVVLVPGVYVSKVPIPPLTFPT